MGVFHAAFVRPDPAWWVWAAFWAIIGLYALLIALWILDAFMRRNDHVGKGPRPSPGYQPRRKPD